MLDGTLAVRRPWQLGPVSNLKAVGKSPYEFMEYIGTTSRRTGYNSRYKPYPPIADLLVDQPPAFLPAPQSREIEESRLREMDLPPYIQPPAGEEKYFDLAAEWLESELRLRLPSEAFEVFLSFDDAVDSFLLNEPDSRKASCGYLPGFKCHTKEDALNIPAVKNLCRTYYNSLFTDDPIYTVFSSSLKDEMLKIEKVRDNKTRLFMVASLEHHLSCYAVFAKFSKALFSTETFCTGGIPFQFGGWNHIMSTRLPHSCYIFADCEKYDIRQHTYLFNLFYKVMIALMPKTHTQVIKNLLWQAMHTIFVTGYGDVYWKHRSNPSGWYMTLIVNTFILYILSTASFIKMYSECHDGDFPHKSKFYQHVALNLIGDDSVFNVSQKYYDLWRAEYITSLWASVGIVVKIIERTTNVLEVEYCGATSVRINGKLARHPRINKFIDSLRWSAHRDPRYIYARAASIATELWPCPKEYDLVKSFMDVIYQANRVTVGPLLAHFDKTERELRHLHLGEE